MKLLLPAALLLSLAACSPPTPHTAERETPKVDPTQAAVTTYLKKTLDDPASYQPAEWGSASAWKQQDANSIAARKAMRFASDDYANAKRNKSARSAYGKQLFDESIASAAHYQHKADSLLRAADTTVLGTTISHAYRAKNKMGALQLDSAHFVVYKTGKVERL